MLLAGQRPIAGQGDISVEKERCGLLKNIVTKLDAEAAGIELRFIWMLENGVREPSQTVARAIAKKLRCSVDRLL